MTHASEPHVAKTPSEPRAPYAAPKLTELGSVKAMTQGSGGSKNGDALAMMA
jgi:hypothetical protein